MGRRPHITPVVSYTANLARAGALVRKAVHATRTKAAREKFGTGVEVRDLPDGRVQVVRAATGEVLAMGSNWEELK